MTLNERLKGGGNGDSCAMVLPPHNPHTIPKPLFFKRLSSPDELLKVTPFSTLRCSTGSGAESKV